MNYQADKVRGSQNRSVAHNSSSEENLRRKVFAFADGRPEAAVFQRLKSVLNNAAKANDDQKKSTLQQAGMQQSGRLKPALHFKSGTYANAHSALGNLAGSKQQTSSAHSSQVVQRMLTDAPPKPATAGTPGSSPSSVPSPSNVSAPVAPKAQVASGSISSSDVKDTPGVAMESKGEAKDKVPSSVFSMVKFTEEDLKLLTDESRREAKEVSLGSVKKDQAPKPDVPATSSAAGNDVKEAVAPDKAVPADKPAPSNATEQIRVSNIPGGGFVGKPGNFGGVGRPGNLRLSGTVTPGSETKDAPQSSVGGEHKGEAASKEKVASPKPPEGTITKTLELYGIYVTQRNNLNKKGTDKIDKEDIHPMMDIIHACELNVYRYMTENKGRLFPVAVMDDALLDKKGWTKKDREALEAPMEKFRKSLYNLLDQLQDDHRILVDLITKKNLALRPENADQSFTINNLWKEIGNKIDIKDSGELSKDDFEKFKQLNRSAIARLLMTKYGVALLKEIKMKHSAISILSGDKASCGEGDREEDSVINMTLARFDHKQENTRSAVLEGRLLSPAFIGLAHELIHASRRSEHAQPGNEHKRKFSASQPTLNRVFTNREELETIHKENELREECFLGERASHNEGAKLNMQTLMEVALDKMREQPGWEIKGRNG